MNYEEALAWLRGERSTLNYTQAPTPEDSRINSAKQDASMTEQAYWIVRAHNEGLIRRADSHESLVSKRRVADLDIEKATGVGVGVGEGEGAAAHPEEQSFKVFHRQRAAGEVDTRRKNGVAVTSPDGLARTIADDPDFVAESVRLFEHVDCRKCGGAGFIPHYSPGSGGGKSECVL